MDRRLFLTGSLLATLTLPGHSALAATPDHPRIALIFVGASWCPVCHAAAAVLAPMAVRSGIDVLVASQDGKPIAPWPACVDARGHRLAASVTAIPTLLFVDLVAGRAIAELPGFSDPRQYIGSIRRILRAATETGHG